MKMDSKIFGLSEQALPLIEGRAVMLTNNIVNSSTPHYKARDIDFNKAMQSATQGYSLTTTSAGHIQAQNAVDGQKLLYRIPMQKSLDGNTVDEDMERKNFIENALRYQVNLTFIQNKSDELTKAMKGD
jgi:flagellar basal-body rod protein FlgB